MGMISNEVAYGFGQMGSAYTDKAVEVIPPVGHVIVAVQFLTNSTPTVLTPERLDEVGPGFAGITGTTAATVLDFEATVTSNINFAGACGSNVADQLWPAYADITLLAPPSDTSLIRKGQYVMITDDGSTENGSTAMLYDVSATGAPIPVYNGPHATGTKVVSWDGVDKVQLDKPVTTSGEALIFLDEHHGAGGITAETQVFPTGVTIYGRWTAFKGEADKGVICYFGK